MGSDAQQVEEVAYRFEATWLNWGGDLLSPEALASLATQLAGVPITINYLPGQPVGRVVSAEVSDEGALCLVGTMTYRPFQQVTFAPGFRVKAFETQADGTRVITELDSPTMGVVWVKRPEVPEGSHEL
jgi:hypothetical protein